MLSAAALVMQAAHGSGIRIDTADRVGEVDLGRLLGGNVALWYQRSDLEDPGLEENLERWRPSLLRLPGGSWSDEIYWNGHGVRNGGGFDHSKLQGHTWQVDFSDYAPGFRLSKADGTLSDFHGHVDVKALHDYVRGRGAAAIVTVNAGTGTPEMAAEWVRWAKQEGYEVAYWEVGNELDGEWELGHVGPDGNVVDAGEYARRFVAFSEAMKAVDPSIKVGGPTASNDQLPFVEAVIREAGDLLDFVTFHTYPVLGGGRGEAERFAKADEVSKAVGRIRGWIAKYQPERVGEIEIGVTEWHKQVMETRPTVDLSSGLWTCLFVGALAESGVDFANQWDYFSDLGGGGHGLFGREGEGARAIFHAMMLWREHMGSVRVGLDGLPDGVRGYATLKDGNPRVMLVNTTRRPVAVESLSIDGKVPAGELQAWRFSQREYFWNPYAERPEWSRPASEIVVNPEGFEVPAFSVLVVGSEESGRKPATVGEPTLEILLPAEAPSDLPVEGWVLVRGEKGAWEGELKTVAVEVDGIGSVDRESVATETSVGRFELRGGGPGETKVTVTAGELRAERVIRWTEVAEREEVFWEFPGEDSVSGLETNYGLGVDAQARPNQAVAVVDLDQALDEPQKNTLCALKTMPDGLAKERVGGVVGMLGGSPELASEDPKAFVQIVVQSNLDHWMPVGRIPLAELRGGWRELSISFDDPRVLEAMHELYAVRFHLKSRKPVSGRIYFDDIGFILRGE